MAAPVLADLIAAGTTGNFDGTATNGIKFETDKGRDKMLVQVDIEGTAGASVTIYGRIAPDMPWIALTAAITASALEVIDRVPYLCAKLTGNAGTVHVAARSD